MTATPEPASTSCTSAFRGAFVGLSEADLQRRMWRMLTGAEPERAGDPGVCYSDPGTWSGSELTTVARCLAMLIRLPDFGEADGFVQVRAALTELARSVADTAIERLTDGRREDIGVAELAGLSQALAKRC